jgi:S1-C subfamily serine protease
MQTTDSASRRTVAYIAIIVLVIVAGFFGGYSLNQADQVRDLTSRVDSLNVEVKSLQTAIQNMQNKLVDVQNKVQEGVVNAPQPQAGNGRSLTTADLSALYDRVKGSVVQIRAGTAGGSGWVYDNENHVVTNFHVVQGTENIEIILEDGTTLRGKVVGTDQYSDLAVISVTTIAGVELKPLPIGDSLKLRVGERVVAVGAPFGLAGSMTQGIVSQVGRLLQAPGTRYSIPNVIQIDAPINPGNSGGPLLNLNGEVIGVTSAGVTQSGGFQGVGLAIPASAVNRVIPSLLTAGVYKHPYLGITGADVSPTIAETMKLNTTRGVLVVEVAAGSPAEKAGIRGGTGSANINNIPIPIGGDVIIGVDGTIVRKIDDVIAYSEEFKKPGDTLMMTIIREGKKMTISIILGERPPPTNQQ